MTGCSFFVKTFWLAWKSCSPQANKVQDASHLLKSLLAREKWVFFNILCVACWAPHSKAVKNDTHHITKNKIYLVSPRGTLLPMKFSKQILDFCRKAHKERGMEQAESAETVIA